MYWGSMDYHDAWFVEYESGQESYVGTVMDDHYRFPSSWFAEAVEKVDLKKLGKSLSQPEEGIQPSL